MLSWWVKVKSFNFLFLWSLEGVICENGFSEIFIVRWIIYFIKFEKDFWKNDLKSIWFFMMYWFWEVVIVIMLVLVIIDKNSINKE